ncbi:MAG: hypothetical protein CL573_06305 [Alphaproteobacteria bacterium]|nr:hypothetical protein [Alphaproteobacteria bacterium]
MNAQAQQSGPMRLAPVTEVSEDKSSEETPTETSGAVLIQGLDAVPEDAVGVLSIFDGSLGDEMWAGTDWATALRLLDALPASFPILDARPLARRLLLSVATPPIGGADKSGLLAARLAGLVAIGAADDVIDLARAVNSREVPDNIATSVVAAHFLRGDTASGCEVLDRFGGGYSELFWQKARIICQIARGKGAEASLGLDLLRDERGETDSLFQNIAYTAAVGLPVTADQLMLPSDPDILTFALMNVAEAELPDWVVGSDDPAIMRAVLASQRVDVPRKLARAHEALRSGRIGADEVAILYEELTIDDETVSDALLDPESVELDLRLACLYLAARNQGVAVARSEALWEAWTLAKAVELDDVVMATTARLLSGVPVTADFGWLAAGATRAALLAGKDALAVSWYQLALRQGRSDADIARATVMMWPEMRVVGRTLSAADVSSDDALGAAAISSITPVAGETGATVPTTQSAGVASVKARAPVPWSAARLSRWIDLADNNLGMTDIGTVLYLLQVFGDPVSETQWARAPIVDNNGLGDKVGKASGNPKAMPSVAALAGLARASAAGRRAETVLYAMIVLGQVDESPHAGIVGSVVRGLQRVGLDTDAQAIARSLLVTRAQ